MTTGLKSGTYTNMLWFAQNSLPLWLKWQPLRVCKTKICSCDLLKIHYLCGWNDNRWLSVRPKLAVVICSKFITFVVEMTTSFAVPAFSCRLWFAQNSLPLWLKWQLPKVPKAHKCVVICSKFITFVVEMTTHRRNIYYTCSCDLLKIHYLCGWNDN